MFSATLHSTEVKRLAANICQQPMLVDLKGHDAVPDTVDHVLVRVDPEADASWLQSTPKVQFVLAHRHEGQYLPLPCGLELTRTSIVS